MIVSLIPVSFLLEMLVFTTEARDDIKVWIYFVACLRRIRFPKEGGQMKGYQMKINTSQYHNVQSKVIALQKDDPHCG